jgi:hypothetical protein
LLSIESASYDVNMTRRRGLEGPERGPWRLSHRLPRGADRR